MTWSEYERETSFRYEVPVGFLLIFCEDGGHARDDAANRGWITRQAIDNKRPTSRVPWVLG